MTNLDAPRAVPGDPGSPVAHWESLTTYERLEKLRAPFPAESVGKLPATPKRPIELDYVGHAAVTDRLLSIDPFWTWEPFATDHDGLPIYDQMGGLWIRLTVCGVTRIGYGDGPDPKQRIGDAIRNAGMRFGIALYLWGKDELESLIGNEATGRRKVKPPKGSTPTSGNAPRARVDPNTDDGEAPMTARDRSKLITWFAREHPKKLTDPRDVLLEVNKLLEAPVEAVVKLSAAQGADLFAKLGIGGSPPVAPGAGGEPKLTPLSPEELKAKGDRERAIIDSQDDRPF